MDHRNDPSALRKDFPAGRVALALAATLVMGACLQTDPGPTNGNDLEPGIPKDESRRAGASSSTNWPSEFGNGRVRLTWGTGGDLRIFFHQVDLLSGGFPPIKIRAKVRFYQTGIIPALESQIPKELYVEDADSLNIPGAFLDTLWKTQADSMRFNIEFSNELLEGWLMGFTWSRSRKEVVSSPLPNKSGESHFMKHVEYYYQGNLKVDTTVLTPAAGKSEFCFYIPGTPVFGPVQADSRFQIGPLPKGEFPLRLLRLTQIPGNPGETLVEAWEAPIDGIVSDFSLTPGPKVLTVRTRGLLSLRPAR